MVFAAVWRTCFLYYTSLFDVYCHLIYIVIYHHISRVVEVISLSVKSTYTLHHDGLAPCSCLLPLRGQTKSCGPDSHEHYLERTGSQVLPK
jgi:hypothetical protein